MKAQFWSFDIIFAIVLFVFAVVLLTLVWTDISGEFSISYSGNLAHMQSQLQSLGTQLLSTGTPSNWNLALNLSSEGTWQNLSVGLGNGTSGALSQGKINSLYNMSNTNYQVTKQSLGIAYEYYITFSTTGVAIGRNPATTNVTSIQSLSLPVVINGVPSRMQIQLWSNSTLSIE